MTPGAPSSCPQNHLEPQTCFSTERRNLFWKKVRVVNILDWRKCPGRQRKEGGIGLKTTAPSEEIRAKSYFSAGKDLDLPTNLILLQAFTLGLEERVNVEYIKDGSAELQPSRQWAWSSSLQSLNKPPQQHLLGEDRRTLHASCLPSLAFPGEGLVWLTMCTRDKKLAGFQLLPEDSTTPGSWDTNSWRHLMSSIWRAS